MNIGKMKYFDLSFGDIIFINFSPVIGREQKGYRHAVVLSDPKSQIQLNGLVAVAPITNTKKNFLTRININDLKSPIKRDVLMDNIRFIDLKSRNFKYVSKLTPQLIGECSIVFNALFEKLIIPL